MGTTWKLRYQVPPDITSGVIHKTVVDAFALIIRQMSHWDPTSELCRFNQAPAGTWLSVSAEFGQVLQRALVIARDSHGCCVPTLGKIVDLHGFGPIEASDCRPTDQELAQAKQHADWSRLRFDTTTGRAFQPGCCQLDLSSIAKGYAVDLAARDLLELGLRDFVLELGGELRGHGCKPDGLPWFITIDTPPDLPETTVALCGISLATSGDSLRRRNVGESEISHLIDPHTGESTIGSVLSVSVISTDCIDADAWATALYVAGPQRGPELAESQKLTAIFTFRSTAGHRQHFSSAAQRLLE